MRKLISLFASALLAISAWAVELQVSYEYVDLGLSVKWATCNLGATSSTDAGWYLAWGETSPKANYTWGTYLSNLDGTMTGWSDAGTDKDPLKDYVYGGSHSEGIGATTYDAATAALGAGYRMPTETEFEELANTDNCEWVWYDEDNTEFNGVAGYKVTSKKTGYTGNSIFLPAAGFRNGESLYSEGSYGYYWSSTPYSGYAFDAYFLYFDSGIVYPDDDTYRYDGFPVRPVYDGPDPAQAAYDYLVSLIGDKRYADSEQDFTVCLNQDDEVQVLLGSYVLGVFDYQDLVVNGNEYYLNGNNNLKFVVEDGVLTHVYAMDGDEVVFEFIENVSGTPTAIDAVNAEKSGKAIKTIENGRVVIIRDNKKYDLSGREL